MSDRGSAVILDDRYTLLDDGDIARPVAWIYHERRQFFRANTMAFERTLMIDPASALLVAGLVALALVPAGALWIVFDPRRVGRERAAIKPTKFALSIAVYLITVAWMLGYARPDRLSSALVQISVSGLLVGAIVELGCITFQAARGQRSHFNTGSSVDAAIAGTMAVVVIPFVGMLLPLAFEIVQRPRQDTPLLMIAGIVGGLVLTLVLGGLTGSGMGRHVAKTGAQRPTPEAPQRTRLQLQLAHFLGIHAMQAMPMMAWVALVTGGQMAPPLLAGSAICYSAVTLLLLYRPTLFSVWPTTDIPYSTNRI
jgi:hypothetical protein